MTINTKKTETIFIDNESSLKKLDNKTDKYLDTPLGFFLTGITPYKAIQPLICMELHKKKVKNRKIEIYIYIYIQRNPKGSERSI